MATKQDPNYEANVIAHIRAHEAKGETAAGEAHMKSPIHRRIMQAHEVAAAGSIEEGLGLEDQLAASTILQLIDFAEAVEPPIKVDSKHLKKADILKAILDELDERADKG